MTFAKPLNTIIGRCKWIVIRIYLRLLDKDKVDKTDDLPPVYPMG